MAVLKEYKCFAHGAFESAEARCPHGCTTIVEREFRTAPGTRSAKTRASDQALEHLAKRFGYTDMSNRNGSVGASKRGPREAPDMSPQWLDYPKNKNREDKSDVLSPALKSLRVQEPTGNEPSFMDISKTLTRPRPNVVKSYGSDKDLAEAMAKQ